ncbi:MAG: tetratricopeptide repeat protein, partial [Cyanobacteria bacterium P01_F01_bin.116]
MAGFRRFGWLLSVGLLLGLNQADAANAVQVGPAEFDGANPTNAGVLVADASAQYQQAQSFLNLGNSQAAIWPLQEAIKLYQAAGDVVGEHNSLIDLSFAHYRLANYNEAQRQLNQAQQLTTPLNQRSRQTLMQGLVWLEQGNVVRSWQQLRQVHRGQLKDFAEQSRLSLALGEVYRHTGQYSRALDTLQATLSRGTDRVDRTRVLGAIGNVHYTLGDYGQAKTAYQSALAEAKSVGYWYGIPRYLNGLGHVYFQQQVYDQARDSYLEAREIAISQGQWSELASILNSLGELYAEQGEFNKALDTLTEA